MDEITKTKFTEIEKRYYDRYRQAVDQFDLRFDQIEKRMSFVEKLPTVLVAVLTAIIIAIAFFSFGQVDKAVDRIDQFISSFEQSYNKEKNDFRSEIETKLKGDPFRSKIKIYQTIDKRLEGAIIVGILFKKEEKDAFLFRLVFNNYSDFVTSDITTKIYFGDSSSFRRGTSSDEARYARELFVPPEKLPTKSLPGHASCVITFTTMEPDFIKLAKSGSEKIPIMVKVYHGPPQPFEIEFFIRPISSNSMDQISVEQENN